MAKSSTLRIPVVALATLLSLAALASLSGCGGGGGDSASPDTTRPYVLQDQVTPIPESIIPRSALIITVKFSETMACPSGVQPLSVKANTGTLMGNYTCAGDLATATVPAASLQDANLRSIEFELSGFTDLAGNMMAAPFTWSYPVVALLPPVTPPPVTPPPVTPPPPLATVSLGATPSTITVGSSTTLSWTATSSTSCVWTEGLSGSLDPAGGNVTVTPTVTTTYGAQCYNSANVATAVVTTTVTVTPVPPKLSYENVVVMRRAGMLFRVDRTVSEAVLPDANTTPWGELYSVRLLRMRVASPPTHRPDCLIEVSGLDQQKGTEHRILYNPKTGEKTVDTSAAGAAWNRDTDYVLSTPWDPVDHPEWAVKLRTPEGWYFAPNYENWILGFQDNAGVVTQLTTTDFFKTGQITGLWLLSCTAQ